MGQTKICLALSPAVSSSVWWKISIKKRASLDCLLSWLNVFIFQQPFPMSSKPTVLQRMLSGLLCFASNFLIQIRYVEERSEALQYTQTLISFCGSYCNSKRSKLRLDSESQLSLNTAGTRWVEFWLVLLRRFQNNDVCKRCSCAMDHVLPLYLSCLLKWAEQHAVKILGFENHRSACWIFYIEIIWILVGWGMYFFKEAY